MTELQMKLFEHRDEAYAAFSAKLAPTLPPASFIGVRVPVLRSIAKTFGKTEECTAFLRTLPHTYYEENILHSVILSEMRDFDVCLCDVERFLPFVDNWAVCDTLRPRAFAKHKEEVLSRIPSWLSSVHTYTCRFGIDMLMTYYLDGEFDPAYPAWVAAVHSEEYYVNMMIAWYFATALAKRWDAVIPYLEEKRLGEWVHRKTVQKACESYRITNEQKSYLRSLVY